jgi:hypothetical protein
MAYCTAAEVKAYIGTVKTTDDTLIAALIVRAESMINGYCKRTFTQREDETRVFDAVKDVAGRILFLDDDLLSIDSITNGDGAELTASQYTLLPNNRSPKYAIKLKASASTTWTYTNDPEAAISVVGCLRHASRRYQSCSGAVNRMVLPSKKRTIRNDGDAGIGNCNGSFRYS